MFIGMVRKNILEMNKIDTSLKKLFDYHRTNTKHRTVGSGNISRITGASYSGREEYFNINLLLLSKTHNQELYLEHGPLSLPFQVTLPMQLPCSFMDKIGQILYTLKATVDIPWYTFHLIYEYSVYLLYKCIFRNRLSSL